MICFVLVLTDLALLWFYILIKRFAKALNNLAETLCQ